MPDDEKTPAWTIRLTQNDPTQPAKYSVQLPGDPVAPPPPPLSEEEAEAIHQQACAIGMRGIEFREAGNLVEALQHYEQAKTLFEKLPPENPTYQHDLARACNNRAVAYFNLGETERAWHDATTGLNRLCDLEKRGIYRFRATRELLFDTAITTYLACRPTWLADFLLEQLDPDVAGSAPQSETMHALALNGLRRLFLKRPDLKDVIQKTLEKLAEIHAQYFIGTAGGARLTAQFYEENGQDLAKAEEVLCFYTEKVPDDPQGYTQLAEFYHRQKRLPEALNSYQTSLRKILAQASPQQQAGLATVRAFGSLLLEPGSWDFDEPKAVDVKFDTLMTWYRDFSIQLITSQQEVFKILYEQVFDEFFIQKQEWWAKRDEYLENQSQEKFKQDYAQKTQKLLETIFQRLHEIVKNLPHGLKTVIDILTNSYEQSWKNHLSAWLEGDAATQAKIEEAISNSNSEILKTELARLPDAELDATEEPLRAALGPLWEKLRPEEQKYLKFGKCLYQIHIYAFACTSFASAVEFSLRERLFVPLKKEIQQQQWVVVMYNDQDFVAGFFKSDARLMLGNLVGAFNQAFLDGKPTTAPENVKYLQQKTSHYQVDTAVKSRRRENLGKILRIRNEFHGTPDQSKDSADKMAWCVFEDPADGFYHYFLPLFSANEEGSNNSKI